MMASEILGLSDATPRNLVLSTWFVLNLRGEVPGGLPADFLTHGAATLLLFNEIICDRSALEAERRSYGWTSSRIFCDLEKEKILRPVDLTTYVPKPFWDALETTGISQGVREAMSKHLTRFRPKSSTPKRVSGLPTILRRTNNLIFSYGLTMPTALRYDWREHYFAAPRGQRNPGFDDPFVSNERAENERRRSRRLTTVLNMLVPRCDLIPRIQPRSDAAVAFFEAKARESSALIRWICGDPRMPREVYHDFRLGKEFADLDRRIDSPTQDTALRNLDRILKIREVTKHVRMSVQDTIAQVVDGIRSAQDVQRELTEQLRSLGAHFMNKSKIASSVFATGPEIAYDVLAEIGKHFGRELPVVGIPFKALHVTESAVETLRNVSEARKLVAESPLGFFSIGANRLNRLG